MTGKNEEEKTVLKNGKGGKLDKKIEKKNKWSDKWRKKVKA